jgi:hypothetical protein
MIINIKTGDLDIIGVVFAGIAVLSVSYLAIVVERHIRKQRIEK